MGQVFCPILVMNASFLLKYGLMPTHRNTITAKDIIQVITRIQIVPLQLA